MKHEHQRKKIAAMKKKHGVTLVDLENILHGVSYNAIRNWAGGVRGMPPEIWRRLVQELDGVDVKYGVDPYE